MALAGVLISALYLAPAGPFADGDVCGFALLHMLLATLCLSILLLNASGPNAAANHGGIGLLVGLAISFIFLAPLKGGQVYFLTGAFPGAVFGLVIGAIRHSIADAHAAPRDANDAEGNETHVGQVESQK